MRKAEVYFQGERAGFFVENTDPTRYLFEYDEQYQGKPISLTMPVKQRRYEFDSFPSFFDGLLPEGQQLDALLKQVKLDRHDYFGQLLTVGADLVGAVTVKELK